MALTQRLELRQGQSLVMTPQLQQAIKLLTLSNLELAEYVEAELEKNPLLEREEGEPHSSEDSAAEAPTECFEEATDSALAREDLGKADDLDAEKGDMYDEVSPLAAGPRDSQLSDWTTLRSGTSLDADDEGFNRSLSAPANLKDHLEAQLSIAAVNDEQRFIAAALIDAIDDGGYLRADICDLSSQLGITPRMVEEVLAIIQGFEPTGVGARDLVECLSLQLR